MSPSTASISWPSSGPVRRIAYLVVPHFLAAVEQRERPHLAHRPVIVAGAPLAGAPATVLDCSRAAWMAGIQPGMALGRAEHLCPEAAFLPPRLDLYRSVAASLFALLHGQAPAVEQAHPGGLYLDLNGVEPSDAGIMALCHRQSEAIAQDLRLETATGVAANKFCAEAAALSIGLNRVLVLAAGTERAFLGDFPVSILPLGEELQRRVQLFGLARLEQFARLPPAAVLAQFGWEGQRAHRLARGLDDRLVIPGQGERSEQAARQFDPPLDNLETLIAASGQAVRRLARRIDAVLLRAGRLAVEISCADGARLAAERILPEPTADPGRLARLAETLLRSLRYPDRVEALAVTLSDLSAPSIRQLSLWQSQQEQDAAACLEQLEARYGPGCFQRSVLVAPDHPLAGRRYAITSWRDHPKK